ncbi:phosphoglucomutase [Geoalkalibacter ferrihydriticus DSM 17813]|uniref:Alpha-ribazole phosphatase n=2 Tax=Geoalkalibacter ferrihydriticus TaxID=392333 RepID=A0A0C2HHA1_9BACT|nr:phosphoglucomutase [Geoalkalibacter ferrihydriticus DSM 17813]
MTEHTRLYLIRHGQVEGFGNKRYNGQADVALTTFGREQSQALGARLAEAPLAAVYTSDLSRCVFAAECLAAPHGLQAVRVPEVRELHIGAWEGRTWQELQELYPEQWQARLNDLVHYRVPGGESLAEMAQRVRPALQRIIERHRGEEVALVGHGGVNRVILLDAIGAPLTQMFAVEQDYGCLNIIDYFADGNAVVKRLNG